MTTSVLAAFASRHQKIAVGLIVLSEFTSVAIGMLLGSSILPNLPGWYLSILLGALVFIRQRVCRYNAIQSTDLVSVERFRFQKYSYFLLFLINFLAYIVAGGICGRAVLHPEPSVSVSSENAYTVISEKDSLVQPTPNQRVNQSNGTSVSEKPGTGTKIAYILLFLASIPLFIFASRLACGLLCSEQGFAAVLVILLGTGVLAGGFYFLGRALTKNMKSYKDMTQPERKREKRRFFRTLLGTVVGLLLFGLIASATN
ncbi:hypothetical protein [Larkinella rosea]|uniref:Uncharacterized protein n=1 Tax=Larkinella rosea TaxID=2025312 RepID=A0A3P1BZW0_9BACT|nr:hypothetical protein [Larkinella rosea]RRB06469.1 hypothetical protein EHT25_01310 [Larkinella rosea]